MMAETRSFSSQLALMDMRLLCLVLSRDIWQKTAGLPTGGGWELGHPVCLYHEWNCIPMGLYPALCLLPLSKHVNTSFFCYVSCMFLYPILEDGIYSVISQYSVHPLQPHTHGICISSIPQIYSIHFSLGEPLSRLLLPLTAFSLMTLRVYVCLCGCEMFRKTYLNLFCLCMRLWT